MQVQDLTYPEHPEDAPDPARDGPGVLAERKDPRANQVHGPPSMDEPTPASGDDVLDPVDVASVGESDQEAVPLRERVDWGSVDASACTATVEDDAEVREPLGHGPKRGVGHATIQSGQPSGKGHYRVGTAPQVRFAAVAVMALARSEAMKAATLPTSASEVSRFSIVFRCIQAMSSARVMAAPVP